VTPSVFIHPPREPGEKFPNSGAGHGPVYFAGQSSWFVGSQEGIFLVDRAYYGAVTVTGQLNGSTVGPAFGGLRQASIPVGGNATYWRSWSGQVAFTQPGCYSLTVSGLNLADTIVLYVHPGPVPPG
jgi:hypothetical protein